MDDRAIGAKIVRVLRGGQVTLPIEFRKALDIEENTMLSMTLSEEEGELRVRPLRVSASRTGGSPWLKELYELFAPVRQEAIDKGYTEEEINQWIDEAVAEVRSERAAREAAGSESIEQQPSLRRTA